MAIIIATLFCIYIAVPFVTVSTIHHLHLRVIITLFRVYKLSCHSDPGGVNTLAAVVATLIW